MGLTQEHFLAKDEENSTASEMNDSAYMSQPDTSRRGVSFPEGLMAAPPPDSRNPAYSSFYSASMFSPALSSGSSNPFQATASDIGQMSLPAASESDLGRSVMGDFSGAAAFTRVPPYDYLTASHGGWSTTDMQSFSGPFTTDTIDTSFMYQPQPSMHQTASPVAYHDDFSTQEFRGRNDSLQGRQSQHTSLNTSMPVMEPTRVSTPSSTAPTENVSRFYNSHIQSYPADSAISSASASNLMHHQMYPTTNSYYDVSSNNASDFVINPQATEVSNEKFDFAEEDDDAQSASNDTTSSVLEESESTKLARTDPLYQATPQDDDLYHCPNEGDSGCNHKPTKLKCNYDKYVDSHLRPFRCKVTSCANTPFSSTACLLRHEREAHGMHGHGSKPHLCSFPDCDRSVPGNGFPRRYNLFDHMKRVHDYTGSASPFEPETPTVPNSTTKRSGPRKRKSSTQDDVPEKRQKTSKSAGINPSLVAQRAREAEAKAMRRQELDKQFQEQRKSVFKLLADVQPNSHTSYDDFMKASDLLKDIMRQHNALGSG